MLAAIVGALLWAPQALAATPASATLTPNAEGQGKVSWTGTVFPGLDVGGTADGCFDAEDKPDPLSGCDFYKLTVKVPEGFYGDRLGGVEFNIGDFEPLDLDMAVYRLKSDGSRGPQVAASGNAPGEPERSTAGSPEGNYIVAVVPFAALPGQTYSGSAEFKLKPTLSISELSRRAAAGAPNYRASHDKYLSHSETSIAMDPLNHDHLMAASKMYENLENYLFKNGTYESFDAGRSWTDHGQMPGYCTQPGYCNPKDPDHYRVVSDPSVAFDDEGDAYENNLDSLGSPITNEQAGWNMTVHVKRPGRPWSGPITAHDNRDNPVTGPITKQLFLDDKNWIAVDNNTDVNGGPNRPGDGKIGTIYICWSFDSSAIPVFQQIALMRSTDGGKTWGGYFPGDNIPYQLSQKAVISGIGCHIAIGPAGEVYVTWYDNQLDALMQVKSTNRGRTFTLARPIALINGVNEQFEGQSFRNLSIPTSAVDRQGNVYVAAASRDAEGAPVLTTVEKAKETLQRLREGEGREELAEGGATCPDEDPETPPNPACSDIVLFKSTDGGTTYSDPVRVNQDSPKSPTDQFQPWLAVTDRGQVNVSYFDRRNDPNNFFIDTYLSRSNDGGKTFHDTRVTRSLWDPRLHPPISPSGEFIGDYQGLAADDEVAIPFFNSTQYANLPKDDPNYSPLQEAVAARVLNGPERGGPTPLCLPRRLKVGRRTLGRIGVGNRAATVATRLGPPRTRGRGVWRYCVRGGGRVALVFSKRRRVIFAATSARGHRRGRVHPGTSSRTLRRVYGRRLHRVARGVFRSGRNVFGVRRGRVRYVAVADRSVARSARRILRAQRKAGFARAKR